MAKKFKGVRFWFEGEFLVGIGGFKVGLRYDFAGELSSGRFTGAGKEESTLGEC